MRESMSRINAQIKEVDDKLDDCEQAIKESIASKQAYCASLVNLDKVSLYKYQIKTTHLMNKNSDYMRKNPHFLKKNVHYLIRKNARKRIYNMLINQ